MRFLSPTNSIQISLACTCWLVEQSLTPHLTQYRSFQRRSSQPITWLILTNKAVQENKHTETKYKSDKVNNLKTAKQNYPGSVASYDTRPGNEVGLFYNDNTHKPRNPHGACLHMHKPFLPCQVWHLCRADTGPSEGVHSVNWWTAEMLHPPSDSERRRHLTLAPRRLRDGYTGTQQTVEFRHPDSHTSTQSYRR